MSDGRPTEDGERVGVWADGRDGLPTDARTSTPPPAHTGPSSSVRRPPSVADQPPPEATRLAALVAAHTGLRLAPDDGRFLAALRARLAATGLAPASYAALAGSAADPAAEDERRRLIEAVLIHETRFLRYPALFWALVEEVFPAVARALPLSAPIEVWSAGCSTGEEAYTLAIAAQEALGPHGAARVRVWGTDLSAAALARAQAARYGPRAVADLPAPLLMKYLQEAPPEPAWSSAGEPHAGHSSLITHHSPPVFQVRPVVRALVEFAPLNLAEPASWGTFGQPGRFAVISCQNVLIYFTPEATAAALGGFARALHPEGWLALGAAEVFGPKVEGLLLRQEARAFFYRHAAAGSPEPPAPAPEISGRSSASNVQSCKDSGQRAKVAAAGTLSVEPARSNEATATSAQEGGVGNSATQRPSEVPDLLAEAQRHADRGETSQALALLGQVLALDPLCTPAYLLQGALGRQQGALDEARWALERARYLDPDSAVVYLRLAEVYEALGRPSAARAAWQAAWTVLSGRPPDDLIEGVPASWLTRSCAERLAAYDEGARHRRTPLPQGSGDQELAP